LAGGLVVGEGHVVAVVQDLVLAEFPQAHDQVQVRRLRRQDLQVAPRIFQPRRGRLWRGSGGLFRRTR
jgi:hypothetical protein